MTGEQSQGSELTARGRTLQGSRYERHWAVGEARLDRWDEIETAERLWTVRPERMKMGREHRVPLSAGALEILDAARERTGGTGWVFSNPRGGGGTLSTSTLSSLLTKLGIAAVPHGFRSSFDGWASERANAPREVIDLALAHVETNKTREAFARSDLFERGRRLMEQ